MRRNAQLFAGRQCLQRQCVNAACKIVGQDRIYHPVALNAALPFEGARHNMNSEMGFSAGPVPCVSFMQMGFIDNAEAFRMESVGQFFGDRVSGGHGMRNIARYCPPSMRLSCGPYDLRSAVAAMYNPRLAMVAIFPTP